MEARLFQNHGDGSPTIAFQQFVVRPMIMMGLTMPILIGPVVLFLPVFIPWLLPKYASGVPSTQILMLGGYFLAVSFPIRGMLAAYGWQMWGAGMILSSVLLHLCLSIGLIKLGLGIEGVAISAGISFAAAGLALFLFVVYRLKDRPAGLLRQGLLVVLPFPLMLVVLYGLLRFGSWLAWPMWSTLVAQLALYGLALLLGVAVAAWAGLVRFDGLRQRVAAQRKAA
jgi:O-antigen/teichoic acid export membrane protein